VKPNRRTSPERQSKPAFSVGPGDGQTSYLKMREISISCYVKDRYAPSEAQFSSLDLRDAIYSEGETLTRLEGEAKGVLLKKLGLTTLESWRRYGSEDAYERYSLAVRKRLKLDVPLRARRPKPEQIDELSEPDRSMVLMHLDHQNARLHPDVLAYATELERQKFFSAVKLRVIDRLRINLNIPWKKQVYAASSGVYEAFAIANKYSVPVHLTSYCFTAETTAHIKHQLELEIARRCNSFALEKGLTDYPIRRLAEVETGPIQLDPTLFSADRIAVERGARDALRREGRPLYPYLNLHGLGCFGDIPLSEVESNWAALERRAAVTSRYRLKRHEIVIKTVFRPDEAGELQPCIEVTAKRLH
jgi:hypothetical protein